MIIIELSGKIGVGKNYVARKIKKMLKETALIVGFADHLKVEVAREYLSVNLCDCLVSQKPKYVREILQFEGTEHGRNIYGEDVWVDRLENWISFHSRQSDIEVFIIPDCRFKNEAEWIDNRCGLLIKIDGPHRDASGNECEIGSESNHISENSLNDYEFKYTLNNNGNNLDEDLRKILKSYARKIGSDINDFLLDC